MTGRANTTLASAIEDFVSGRLASMYVCMPGVIESYDNSSCKASIVPLLPRTYRDGTIDDNPVVPGVPVVFPRSSDFTFSYPLKKGDGVLVLFSQRSMEEYLSSDGVTQMGQSDLRTNDLTDAIAVPGLFPFGVGNPISTSDSVEISYKNKAKILIGPGGDITIECDGKLDVTANEAVITSPTVKLGDGTTKKLVTEDFITQVFDIHTHPTAPTGPVSVPTPLPVPVPTATTSNTEAS